MAWYDMKEHCPEEPCDPDQKVPATEWNAMITYLKDKICNIPLATPAVGDDGKVIGYDHAGGKFDYITAGVADPLTLGTLYVDYIFEKTADEGVTIEGVLNRDGYLILGGDLISRNVDDDWLTICGGTFNDGAVISLYGQEDADNAGDMSLSVPSANKNVQRIALRIGGVSDTPHVECEFGLDTNIIAENTADTGVTIDGVLNKDGNLELSGNLISRNVDDDWLNICGGTHNNGASINLGGENTGNAGDMSLSVPSADKSVQRTALHIGGVSDTPHVECEFGLDTNIIAEDTADTGVTIDGFLIKDDTIDGGTW